MDNIQENVIQEQETNSAEVSGKKSKKKTGLIIAAVAVVAVIVVALLLILGGAGDEEIEIDGKSYSYSAEEGIEDIEKISNGVVVFTGFSGELHTTSGEVEDISGVDVLSGKYPIVYMGTRNIVGTDIAVTSYTVYGEFKTSQGATHKSTKSELGKKDYMVVGDVYNVIKTDKGIIDYAEIEKDYEKIISTKSFKDIDYIDNAILDSDAAKIAVGSDDVDMLLDVYADGSEKDGMIFFLAKGKAVDMIMNKEAQYIVEECVYSPEDGQNVLYISIYTTVENGEKIRESMGIKK